MSYNKYQEWPKNKWKSGALKKFDKSERFFESDVDERAYKKRVAKYFEEMKRFEKTYRRVGASVGYDHYISGVKQV